MAPLKPQKSSGLTNGAEFPSLSVCIPENQGSRQGPLKQDTEGQEVINQTSIRFVKEVGGSDTGRMIAGELRIPDSSVANGFKQLGCLSGHKFDN